MRHNNFYSLMMEYGTLTGLEHPGQVIDGSPIYVNDVLFSLIYDQNTNPGKVFICGDLGSLPQRNSLDIQRTMLSANLQFYTDYGTCLAISPTNGHALLCLNLPLDMLTAEGLHERLQTVSSLAVAWKEVYLTENAPAIEFNHPPLPTGTTSLNKPVRERR